MERKGKSIIKVFEDLGFNIQANLQDVDFLDVTLKLPNGIYLPYKKHY